MSMQTGMNCSKTHSPLATLQNGEALIKYGERGDKLYLIRYGKVRILRPDDSAPGGRVEVAKLGRGNLVGERTVVTGKGGIKIKPCLAAWLASCG